MTLVGVVLCALSVSFFRQAAFGTDPFQCMCAGLNRIIPLSFGTLYMLINLVLLVVDFFMDRHYIGIATFMNLFLTGYLIDFAESILVAVAPDPGMLLRVIYLVVGIVVMCFAASLYFTGDLGVSTYDAIALYLDRKIPVHYRFIRITTDLICVGIGFACGEMPGIGTLVTALFMGPLISLFRTSCAEPLLHGKKQ